MHLFVKSKSLSSYTVGLQSSDNELSCMKQGMDVSICAPCNRFSGLGAPTPKQLQADGWDAIIMPYPHSTCLRVIQGLAWKLESEDVFLKFSKNLYPGALLLKACRGSYYYRMSFDPRQQVTCLVYRL